MVQVYFFTVNSLLIAGFTLSLNEKFLDFFPVLRRNQEVFENFIFQLVVGVVTLICSLVNLVQYTTLTLQVDLLGTQIILWGYLLPGILGILSGSLLVNTFFIERLHLQNKFTQFLRRCMPLRVPLGMLTILASILHLILPRAVFFPTP